MFTSLGKTFVEIEKTAALPRALTQAGNLLRNSRAGRWAEDGLRGTSLRQSRQMAQRQQGYQQRMSQIPLNQPGARRTARQSYLRQHGSPGTPGQQRSLRNRGLVRSGAVYGGGAYGASQLAGGGSGQSRQAPPPQNLQPQYSYY